MNRLRKFFIIRMAALIVLPLLSLVSYANITVHLKTENAPPFNMEDENGRVVGMSTEIVKALFERAGISYDLEILSWSRAYKLALDKKDHAVFSTTRTLEREKLFKWVGPIVNGGWVFLKKRGADHIVVNKFEDAKRYRVGSYYGDALTNFLKSKDFEIDYVMKDHLNARKIGRDRIDLWATGRLLGPYHAKVEKIEDLEIAFEIKSTVLSIAFNANTDDSIIKRLNLELDSMVEQGLVDEIKSKYLLNL